MWTRSRSLTAPARSPRRWRPELEPLEPRLTPADLLPTGANDFRISNMGTGPFAFADDPSAAVAYNSTDDLFLVVWAGNEATQGGEPEIHGRLVRGSTGATVVPDFLISDMGTPGDINFAASAPAVAYNSIDNEFLVVWSGDDNIAPLVNDEFEIFGQRLNAATGAQVGADDFRISRLGADGSTLAGAFTPSVAYNRNNNQYLVVYSGDVVDEKFNIFGRLVGATGTLLSDDFLIPFTNNADPALDAIRPAVVYNSFEVEFLVVWESDNGTDDKSEIFGQVRDAQDGRLLVGDFPIGSMGPAGDTRFDAVAPAAAYDRNDNQYLVVWSGDDATDGEFEIHGRRVDAAGNLLGADHFPISAMGSDPAANVEAQRPAIDYNLTDNQYLVVWEGRNPAGLRFEVFGQRLNAATGAAVGADDFRIAQSGNGGVLSASAADAAVAFGTNPLNQYLVVWAGTEDLFGSTELDLFGQRLNAAGAEVGANDARLTGGDTRFDTFQPAAAYNSRDDLYLVVWAGDDIRSDQEFEIYGRLFQATTGTPLGPYFRISEVGDDGDSLRNGAAPAVAYNSARNEFLVVWTGDEIADEELEIWGQRLDAANGNPLGNDFRISSMGPINDPAFDAVAPAVAYNSVNDQYLVVWAGSNTVAGEFDIYGQRLDGAGNFTGASDFRISDMGPDNNPNFGASDPAVAYNTAANQYLVVWASDDDAAPLVDNEFEIFGQLLNAATGAAVGANDFRISDMGPDGVTAFGAGSPAVVYNAAGNEYLVVWAGDDTTNDEFEIFGQRLNTAGTAVGINDFRISDMGIDGLNNFFASEPAVVYSVTSNEYLVVWCGNDNTPPLAGDDVEIHGQRLSGSAGAELGVNDFRISDMGPEGSTDFSPFSPAVAFRGTGNEFLVVWSGNDDTAPLVDNEFEIFGQRLRLTVDPAAQPAPAARAVRAVLRKVKQGPKQVLFVVVLFADTGAEKRRFRSPFQAPKFKGIQVKVEGAQVVLSGRRAGVFNTRRFDA